MLVQFFVNFISPGPQNPTGGSAFQDIQFSTELIIWVGYCSPNLTVKRDGHWLLGYIRSTLYTFFEITVSNFIMRCLLLLAFLTYS